MQKTKNLYILLLCSFSFYILAEKKILVFCSEGSPNSLNPQIGADRISLDATNDVYNGLLDFDKKTAEIVPDLAVSWEVSKNGLQYTFYLRKGVSFHETKNFKPTRNLNADDVIFSFQRVFDKNHPYHKVSGGNYTYISSTGLDTLVNKIIKINDYKIRFELKEKNAVFLTLLAMPFSAIFSQEYADQLLKNKTPKVFDQKPVGTGPFILTEYIADSFIRYKTNQKYFKKPSNLDGLVFSITPDPAVRLQKLKREECHLMSFPLPHDYHAIINHKKLKLIQANAFSLSFLSINTQHPPLNKVKVRQALRHALNRSLYIKSIYKGYAQEAKGPLPPNMWSYDIEIKDYEYSVKKAKQLLKSAGLEKGFEVELWTIPISRPYNPSGKKLGELMKEDLAKVGIKARLVTYDWSTYLKKGKQGLHQLLQMGWTSENGDPDNFFSLLTCAGIKNKVNYSRWCHKPYDQLINRAVRTLNKNVRIELYKKAQKIFAKESPFVPLTYSPSFRGVNKKVQGYTAPFGSESFYGVDLIQ